MIPKIIYMCDKKLDDIEIYSQNWRKLNPEYEIKLYDDKLCEKFLLEEFSLLHHDIFKFIPDGPIKADFWRICILYKYGGIYSDADIEPLVPLKDFIENEVDFVTCSSYWDDMKFNFNPNFIMAYKGDIILKKCIDWYIDKYNNKTKYGYWDWSIMRCFTDVLLLNNYKKEYGIYYLNEKKIQIIKECPGNAHYDSHNIYNEMRVFNNRYRNWNYNTHSFHNEYSLILFNFYNYLKNNVYKLIKKSTNSKAQSTLHYHFLQLIQHIKKQQSGSGRH